MIKTMELATQDDGVFLYPHWARFNADAATKLTTDLGCNWIRFNILSSYLGRMGWGPWDEAIDRARAAGLNVQLTISGQPRWDIHSEDAYNVGYEDPDPEKFADFAVRVAYHLKEK